MTLASYVEARNFYFEKYDWTWCHSIVFLPNSHQS